MSYIRSYMKPIEIPLNKWIKLSDIIPDKPQYEEMFVILEEPLLEVTKTDLGWLRAQGIDILTSAY